MRKSRKQEHIENYLLTSFKSQTLFDNVYIGHCALSNKNLAYIDTSVKVFGKKISFPFMINAMTGGSDFAEEINENLAKITIAHNQWNDMIDSAIDFLLDMGVKRENIIVEEMLCVISAHTGPVVFALYYSQDPGSYEMYEYLK